MREHVVTWGRARWPGSRVVHELVAGLCRVDVAFVDTHHIAVVEIKSERDTLDRLDRQCIEFRRHFPEVWLAFAPKWTAQRYDEALSSGEAATLSRLVVAPRGVIHQCQMRKPDRTVTVPLLRLLWRDELVRVAQRARLIQGGSRSNMKELIALCARGLTGDEIVGETCRELRARGDGRLGPAFGKGSDAPIRS